MDRSLEVFNVDRTKNGEVTRFTPLELEINRHIEKINVVVTDLIGMDMFLEYDQLVKHNLEVNWDKGTIQFTRCPRECRTKHQDILFISKARRVQPTENTDKKHQERTRSNKFRRSTRVYSIIHTSVQQEEI